MRSRFVRFAQIVAFTFAIALITSSAIGASSNLQHVTPDIVLVTSRVPLSALASLQVLYLTDVRQCVG
jgi:hypothetical protein